MSSIFVSIASYCDPMLKFTIKSLEANLSGINNINLSVVDQSNFNEFDLSNNDKVRGNYLKINPGQSLGACWARSIAMNAFNGEDFFLQVDSHTAFAKNWDEILLNKYHALDIKLNNKHYVISTRPHPFGLDDEMNVSVSQEFCNTVLLRPKTTSIFECGPPILFDAIPAKNRMAYRGMQISAAFLFAKGSLIEQFPYDPYLYFHGEEQAYSVRLFTGGWDIWHISNVPVYHMYKSRSPNEPKMHWSDTSNSSRPFPWEYYNTRSNKRLYKLLSNDLKGVYGLKSSRDVSEYLSLSGLRLI